MPGRILSPAEVLARIPQREPFRFVDEIVAIDEEQVVARYHFREGADFYRGHFPGRPVTPGVILVETMAQAGVVAHAIYLLARDHAEAVLEKLLLLFSDADVEYEGVVLPGERVEVRARKRFFRHGKLSSEVEMFREDGTLVCRGVLSGFGVPR